MAQKDPIIYVTREIERALGTTPSADYRIITNRTAYGEKVRNQYPDFVTLIADQAGELLGTGDLIKRPETAEVMAAVTQATGKQPHILVFKNTARIEPLVSERGWTLLNPPAALAEKIENKVSQVMWLGSLGKYLPIHRLEYLKNVPFEGTPFIIQWAHGHTGAGTILIQSQAELDALKVKFPERRTRVTEYLHGPSFTVNVVVAGDKVLVGSVSYQITGLPPFTDNSFSTVGNDWSLPHKLFIKDDVVLFEAMVHDIGNKMKKEGWLGLFGIDVMKDVKSGKLRLIEINARQAASSTFESELQEKQRTKGMDGLTLFEAHLSALLKQPVEGQIIEIDDGAQIVQRVTKDVNSVSEDVTGSLELAGYDVMAYENTELGSDLVRIQSEQGLMESDNALNEDGREIAGIVSKQSL